MSTDLEVGLRVQVAFDRDTAGIIRSLAEREHRTVRYQCERLVLEALAARGARRIAPDGEEAHD